MKTILVLGVAIVASVAGAAGVGWKNVGAENQLGGRKASEGYLQGRVVMVYKGGDQMSRMEQVWQGFKTKEFVLVGAGAEKDASCTFPQYRGAGLASDEPSEPIYVVGPTGKVLYRGGDERAATESVVMALTDLDAPRTLAQWKEFLDFEFANLPAHAYIRIAAFKKKFPSAAKDYADKILALRAVKNVDKVAKLVALARQAKDMKDLGPKKKMLEAKMVKAVKAAIPKYRPLLKDIADERLLQEAKNALADLTWKAAEL